ncbi:uncharacterized protein C7orf57 homolog isoform X2 [Carassius auratus]|uniref:Uncharacterized protein C7orf57 homolog isoform X2 n=1 Tax=Carassius auratus TaxID=7957 RepID=A0A6P6P166_CARAU|nr:uncharacterized protein C7orf57 homolog isoform X2 [Carassius auratus]XP_052415410.1 uncharacterized protein C7orf57 homolog isoform X2 [Carassius gibelio]
MAAEPNYRRTKPGVRTANLASSNGAVGPSSQIPGLSANADITPEEKTKGGRRVGVQASDSDYVKLAKQGGQRGLLSHDDPVETKPNSSYKPSNWFSGAPDDQESSEATTPDGNGKSKVVLQHLDPPFGTDNCSAWDSGKKNVNQAASEMQKLSLSQKEIGEANKFKKISHDKKGAAPVNMSKLLGFGYNEEENKTLIDDDASSITSEQTSTMAPEDQLE